MKNLINTKSLLFKIILLATLFLLGFQTKAFIADHSGLARIMGLCVIGLGVVNLIAGFIPWYGGQYKGLGIEQHIERAAILTTYLLLVNHILFFFGADVWPWQVFLMILFAAILILNLILIYYHLVDKDKTPPSYFAANLYLKGFVLFFLFATPVLACPSPQWLSANRVKLDNVTLTRPNDRWQLALDHDDTSFANLVYTTNGANPKIRIDVTETDYTFSAKRLKNPNWQKKFEKNMLAAFRKQGFAFNQNKVTENSLSAQGTNAQDQNILVTATLGTDGKSAVLASVVLQGGQSKANDQIKKDFDVVAKNLKLE